MVKKLSVFFLLIVANNLYSQSVDHYLSTYNVFMKNDVEKRNYEDLYVSLVHSQDFDVIGLSLSPTEGGVENVKMFKMSIKDVFTQDGIKYFVFDCRLTKNNVLSSRLFTAYISLESSQLIIFYDQDTYQAFNLDRLVTRENIN